LSYGTNWRWDATFNLRSCKTQVQLIVLFAIFASCCDKYERISGRTNVIYPAALWAISLLMQVIRTHLVYITGYQINEGQLQPNKRVKELAIQSAERDISVQVLWRRDVMALCYGLQSPIWKRIWMRWHSKNAWQQPKAS